MATVGARNIRDMIADVLRETRGQATVYEAQQAIQDSFSFIDATANWEFLIGTQLINLIAPVTTGTVSCVHGTDAVTLSGSTWTPTVATGIDYREIKFASRDLPYKCLSVGSTSAQLSTVLSGTDDLVGDSYVLYQARYALPSDCEPGRDLALKGPLTVGYNGNLPKRERLIYDRHTQSVFQLGVPMYYTDDEFDSSHNIGTIRVEPYPARTYEFRMTYYKSLTVPSSTPTVSSTASTDILIPKAFERAPILMAASNILRKKNMQGWQVMRQEAADLLNKMYNRYACSAAYEGKINPQEYVGELDGIFGFDGVMYVTDGM